MTKCLQSHNRLIVWTHVCCSTSMPSHDCPTAIVICKLRHFDELLLDDVLMCPKIVVVQCCHFSKVGNHLLGEFPGAMLKLGNSFFGIAQWLIENVNTNTKDKVLFVILTGTSRGRKMLRLWSTTMGASCDPPEHSLSSKSVRCVLKADFFLRTLQMALACVGVLCHKTCVSW